jgi:hypothetical protein
LLEIRRSPRGRNRHKALEGAEVIAHKKLVVGIIDVLKAEALCVLLTEKSAAVRRNWREVSQGRRYALRNLAALDLVARCAFVV